MKLPAATLEGLKPYQVRSIEWALAHPYAGVLLDPGLGKTLIELIVYYLLRKKGYVDRLLVVAPLTPCYQVWPRELEKWGFPFSWQVLHGPKKDQEVQLDADVSIVNWDGLGWLNPYVRDLRKRGEYMCVFDESHKGKSTTSDRHRQADAIAPAMARRIIATGTIIPNGYVDLFGQMKLCDGGKRLGRFKTPFEFKHFHTTDPLGHPWRPGQTATTLDGKVHQVPRPPYLIRHPTKKGERAIRDAIKDVCLHFSDRELGLPPWLPVERRVTLPPKVRKTYDELEEEFFSWVAREGGQSVLLTASNAGVAGMKLRQVANGSVLWPDRGVTHLHSEKDESVADLFEELGGKSLFVAYEFTHDRARLQSYLRKRFKRDFPHIDGQIKIEERLRLCDRFNTGDDSLLLVQCSMMEGLNLQQTCHDVCWHGIIWNLEHYIQLIKRIHRMGQKHKVRVHHVVAEGTRDERAYGALASKKRNQDGLLKAIREEQAA